MKTTLDIVQILWDHLNASALKEEISGGVYKVKRPLNSKLEDVVINCLPVNGEQLQKTIANVNVFVPSLVIGSNQGETLMPDFSRLQELGTLAGGILKAYQKRQDYHFLLQQQSLLEDETSKSYFINIRVEFYSYNF